MPAAIVNRATVVPQFTIGETATFRGEPPSVPGRSPAALSLAFATPLRARPLGAGVVS